MFYNEENLKSEEFLKQIRNQAQDMMMYDEIHEASHLITSLEQALNEAKDFKDKNYYLYVEYKKIIIRLKWLVLNILTDDEVIDLFRNHFKQTYKIPDYEVRQKLKSYLLGFIIFQDRDYFKKELRLALLNNQEKLTDKKLIINNQEKDPTVGNWILEYNSIFGSGEIDNIKRIQYFTNDKNIKILDEKEKIRVKILLDLYEKLKLSSLTLEGLEEDIPVDEPGHEGIIRGGVFEPFKEEKINPQVPAAEVNIRPNKRAVEADELNAAAEQYPAGSLERKAVEEEMKRLNVK